MKINYINKDNFNMEAETPQEEHVLELIHRCFMDSMLSEDERKYLKVYIENFKVLSIQQRYPSDEFTEKFIIQYTKDKVWEAVEEATKNKKPTKKKRKKK